MQHSFCTSIDPVLFFVTYYLMVDDSSKVSKLVRWDLSEFLDRRWLFFPRIFFHLRDGGRCSLPTALLGADWFGALSYCRFLKRKSTMVSIHHHVDFYRGIGMFPVLRWGESERLTDCTSHEKVDGTYRYRSFRETKYATIKMFVFSRYQHPS
jgi:hypothetical protein